MLITLVTFDHLQVGVFVQAEDLFLIWSKAIFLAMLSQDQSGHRFHAAAGYTPALECACDYINACIFVLQDITVPFCTKI